MRGAAAPVALAALAMALLAVPSATAHTGDNSFHVLAHDDGSQFWFAFEGIPGRNPSVALQPHTTYTFEFVNQGTVAHDFHIGDTQVIPLLEKGKSATGSFTTGDDGRVEYFCAPHRSLGMTGRATIGTGEEKSSPAPVLVAPLLLAAAAGLRRRTA